MTTFAIIGYGFMGHCHKDMLKTFPECRLVAVCDTVESQMDDLPPDVMKFTDVNDLLMQDFDTVIISSPNTLHLTHVTMCAKAKKNIICEKPAAMTVPEFDAMCEICKKQGVLFTVHQQRRYDPDYGIMRRIYDRGMLGNVYTVSSAIYGFNGNMHDWHIYPELGGGMLYDWGVHLIDQMLYMIKSPVKSVFADVRNVINRKVDDYFNIFLRFECPVCAHIELGTYYLSDRPMWFEKHWFMGGEKKCAYIDGFEPKGKIVSTTRLLENVPGKITMSYAGPTRSFGPPPPDLLVTEPLPEVNCRHRDFFVNYLRHRNGEEDILVKTDEVRRVLRLMDAVRESAKTGQSVSFE